MSVTEAVSVFLHKPSCKPHVAGGEGGDGTTEAIERSGAWFAAVEGGIAQILFWKLELNEVRGVEAHALYLLRRSTVQTSYVDSSQKTHPIRICGCALPIIC